MSESRGEPPVEAPRGFVRMYVDLYPEESDYLTSQVKQHGVTKRAYIRNLLLDDMRKKQDGKGKGKTK